MAHDEINAIFEHVDTSSPFSRERVAEDRARTTAMPLNVAAIECALSAERVTQTIAILNKVARTKFGVDVMADPIPLTKGKGAPLRCMYNAIVACNTFGGKAPRLGYLCFLAPCARCGQPCLTMELHVVVIDYDTDELVDVTDDVERPVRLFAALNTTAHGFAALSSPASVVGHFGCACGLKATYKAGTKPPPPLSAILDLPNMHWGDFSTTRAIPWCDPNCSYTGGVARMWNCAPQADELVTLTALKRDEYNGARARVLRRDANGRYVVKLENAKPFSVLASKMVFHQRP
jgi:hypothetical protein